MKDALNIAMERLARINFILVPRNTFAETEQNVRAVVISLFKNTELGESAIVKFLNEWADADERRALFEFRKTDAVAKRGGQA